MSITDELRRYAANWDGWFYDDKDGGLITAIGHVPAQSTPVPKVINAIADRIDEKHAGEVGAAERNGYVEAMDKVDSEYVKLPVDADGVPVHVGDVMEWPTTGETFEVVGIGDGTLFYVEDGEECADLTGASTKRHHREPTVEDVLREFAERYLDYEGMPSAGRRGVGEALMNEYAAKLRLAGEAE